MVEKSTLFPRTFFGVNFLVKKANLFPLTFFDIILMVEKYTLFVRTFLTKFGWVKIRRKLENIQGGFPLLDDFYKTVLLKI